MSLWQIGIWLVGSIGIAGTIALFLLYPAIITTIWKAIIAFFSFVLTYRIGCALVAAVITAAVVDYARHSYDDKRFAAATEEFKQAQAERDTTIAQQTRDEVWTEIANATAENQVADKQETDFETQLAPAPVSGPNPFRVGADAPALRSIFGQSGGGPRGAKGVPKTVRKGVGTAHH